MTNSALIPVPFHGNTLFLVTHNDQPYTPMKPIVEGMGLDWEGQRQKLSRSTERWGTCVIKVPSKNGNQETFCIPLRKLPGWLMTIQPSRVKPEIREKILQYQNECDDVLWEYWTKGHVTNPRIALPARRAERDTRPEKLTLEHQEALAGILLGRTRPFPAEVREHVRDTLLRRVYARFMVGRLPELADAFFPDVVEFLERIDLAGILPGRTTPKLDPNFLRFSARPSRSRFRDYPDTADGTLFIQDHLIDPDSPDPLEQAIEKLDEAGYEVEGLRIQYRAMKGHLMAAAESLDKISRLSRDRRRP